MSRYIDADKLKEYVGTHNPTFHVFIDAQPTADVVEVVRCKDCKYRCSAVTTDRVTKERLTLYWCDNDTGDPYELGRDAENDDWFCADGERRIENEETSNTIRI